MFNASKSKHEEYIDAMIKDHKTIDEIIDFIDHQFECGSFSYTSIDKLVSYAKSKLK